MPIATGNTHALVVPAFASIVVDGQPYMSEEERRRKEYTVSNAPIVLHCLCFSCPFVVAHRKQNKTGWPLMISNAILLSQNLHRLGRLSRPLARTRIRRITSEMKNHPSSWTALVSNSSAVPVEDYSLKPYDPISLPSLASCNLLPSPAVTA